MRNIEIKAKVQNVVELIQKAKNIAGTDPVTIIQNDVFFNSSQGRLKLRKFEVIINKPLTSIMKLFFLGWKWRTHIL